MGNNYYRKKRGYETIHIGKSSIGWTFMFRGYIHGIEDSRGKFVQPILNYQEWIEELSKGGKIVDDYGRVLSLDEFKAMVEAKRDEPNSHYQWVKDNPAPWRRDDENWLDGEGHSFSDYEFS